MRPLRLAALAAAPLAAPIVLAGFVLLAAHAEQPGYSPTAVADMPPAAAAAYQQAVAARCPTLPAAVLAAIGKVESDHNRNPTPPPPRPGRVVGERPVGPMQFLPSTWAAYALDGNGDGTADPTNLVDAAHSAAAYLCAHGAADPQQLRHAIWAYNHDWGYVDHVLAQADTYLQHPPPTALAAPATIGAVLSNPRLVIYDQGRDDIAAGRIDGRVLTLLQTLAQTYTLHVSALETGHSRCVGGGDYPGCTVSNHWQGRAMDIYQVNNTPVGPSNPQARALVDTLARLQGPLRPDEIGSPWPDSSGLTGMFSDANHQDHIHAGWNQ